MRVELPEAMSKEEAIHVLEKTGSVDEFFDNEELYPNHQFEYVDIENTEEDMLVEENDGQSTLELYDEDNNLIWQNGKGDNLYDIYSRN